VARLFITSRELDLISDLTKEIIKDVAGQKIFYYTLRTELSNTNSLYREATEKVFDPPIELEAFVEWGELTTKADNFGVDVTNTVNVSIHYRDLLDKDVHVKEGDYFSYGSSFYEIAQAVPISKIFGQVEHITGYKLIGKYARQGLIDKRPLGPSEERFTDPDAVQETFVQQRGVEKNELGETNDRRELVEKGVIQGPISGPRKVAPDTLGSSFYGDGDS
jgi:hypothetical protein